MLVIGENLQSIMLGKTNNKKNLRLRLSQFLRRIQIKLLIILRGEKILYHFMFRDKVIPLLWFMTKATQSYSQKKKNILLSGHQKN